jgi:hypothetical protein
MKVQAELFEQSIKLMREPTKLAKSAAGVDKKTKTAKKQS